MNLTPKEISNRHGEFRDYLLKKLGTKFRDLPSEEMLAVTCQLVGQMIALQDRRKYDADAVMKIVSANIEEGNAHAISAVTGGIVGNC